MEWRRRDVLGLAKQFASATDDAAKTTTYFPPSAVEAMTELRTTAERNGCGIRILAFDTPGGFATQDGEYLAASQVFFNAISARLGASVTDARESFRLMGGKFSDFVHLNANGADEISALIAAKIGNRSLPRFP